MNYDLIFSEGCLACITAYLVYLCTETHYEKVNTDIQYVFFSQLSHYSLRKISVLLFAVHSKGIQVYWSTEWTNLQSKRFTNNRSNVSWITSNRNINTRSSWKNLTATFAFNRRIFYVNFLNQSRQKKEKYCLIPL